VADEVIEADVAVIGAGPAGIAAATCAAEAGRRVVLVDEAPRPGGQIWRHIDRAGLPATAQRWLGRLDRSGASVLQGTAVVDVLPGFVLAAERDGQPLTVSAPNVILATGARERLLPFPGWTLPGVVGAGGAQALLKSGTNLRGQRVVIAGTGPLLLAVAGALARAGVRVTAVIEQAPARRVYEFAASLWRSPARVAQALIERASSRSAQYITGSWVQRATGDETVTEVVVTDARGRQRVVPCDLLCVGYGLVPVTELARRSGCAVEGGRVVVDAHQRTSIAGVWCAGEPTGIGGVDASLVEGEIAGRDATGDKPPSDRLRALRDSHRRFAARLDLTFALRDELRAIVATDTIVCRCEDVTWGRIAGDWSARETKLRTRAGMGPCQGRICGAALEFLLDYGTDSIRPPVLPARISTLIETSAQGTDAA
jgi:NADPH-dependent 2,4-dienoyl-CoA reductase/sulfur reductase-like enzyme